MRVFLFTILVIVGVVLIMGIIGVSRAIGIYINASIGWGIGIILIVITGLSIAQIYRKLLS